MGQAPITTTWRLVLRSVSSRSRPLLRRALRHNIIVVITTIPVPWHRFWTPWDGISRPVQMEGMISHHPIPTSSPDQLAPAGWVTFNPQHRIETKQKKPGHTDVTVMHPVRLVVYHYHAGGSLDICILGLHGAPEES